VGHLLPYRQQGSCEQGSKSPVLAPAVSFREALVCRTATAAEFLDDLGFVTLLIVLTSFWRSGPAIHCQLLREFTEKWGLTA